MEPIPQEPPKVRFEGLKQITPLSKFLAMLLFIALPFIGGYLGYMYAPVKMVEISQPINDQRLATTDASGNDTHIKNQVLVSDFEEQPHLLPRIAVVSTLDGQTLQLELLQTFPRPELSSGIYKLGNELYAYDGVSHSFTYIPNSDAATFTVLPAPFSFEIYAKDKNQVYCKGNILAGADVATFNEIPGWKQDEKYRTDDDRYVFFQDKDNQYEYDTCIAVRSSL